MKEFQLSLKDAIVQNSSNGNLLKWYQNGMYIKTSTYRDFGFNRVLWMYESYSELIVCRLCKEIGIENLVMYYPCIIHLEKGETTLGCYCNNFLSDVEKYESIASMMKSRQMVDKYSFEGYNGYMNLINDIGKITGIHYKEELNKILELDYIILNQDRHLGNMGFVYNLKTRKFRVAPIFDNGDSLFSLSDVSQFNYSSDLDAYANARPFMYRHKLQVQLLEKRRFRGKKIDNTLSYIDKLVKIGLDVHRAEFIKQLLIDRINK